MRRMFEDYPDVMTVTQAAKALQLGKTTVYRLIQEKALLCLHVGRKIIIPKPYLVDFVMAELVAGEEACYNKEAIAGESDLSTERSSL